MLLSPIVIVLTFLHRECDGHTHTTFSANIRFLEEMPYDKFKNAFYRSIVRLRHLVPGIAYTLTKLPSSEFQFSYRVPDSLEEVFLWINDIVLLSEDPVSSSIHHKRVGDRYWKASDGRNYLELHASPNERDDRSWSIS